MPNTKSRPVTVRIPNEVLDVVDAEAEALGMSRSEVVTRRLRTTISRGLRVQKTHQIVGDTNEDLVLLPEEEPVG